jgi:hemerythrin
MERESFVWKEAYTLGHPEVDAEHRKLFEIAARACSASSPDERLKKIKSTITDLSGYMMTHFENEENFMRSVQHPYEKSHAKLHADIIEEMNRLIQRIPTMRLHQIEQELLRFVERGLIHHITTEDRKIHHWLAKNR